MAVRPLTSRPMDLVYFIYFLTHIPASFLLDFQALNLYPKSIVPDFVANLPVNYVQFSNDPLVGSALGLLGSPSLVDITWFKTFLVVEAVFQLPVFVLGMRGLWQGSQSIYLLLLIYAASTTTTTLPCITTILALPTSSPSTVLAGVLAVTPAQRFLLLASYLPYLLLPFYMTIDMAVRVCKLVSAGIQVEAKRKQS